MEPLEPPLNPPLLCEEECHNNYVKQYNNHLNLIHDFYYGPPCGQYAGSNSYCESFLEVINELKIYNDSHTNRLIVHIVTTQLQDTLTDT